MDERDATLDEYNGITGHSCPSLIPIFVKPRGPHRATMATHPNHPASPVLPPLFKFFSDFSGPSSTDSYCSLRTYGLGELCGGHHLRWLKFSLSGYIPAFRISNSPSCPIRCPFLSLPALP